MTDPAEPAELIDAVTQLRRSIDAFGQRFQLFKFGLSLTGFGLSVSLLLSVLFSRFFAAETGKVAGQIKGINRIVPPPGSGIKADPAAGVIQFRNASQHYLNVIHTLDLLVYVAGLLIIVGLVVMVVGRFRAKRQLDKQVKRQLEKQRKDNR